MDWKTIITQAQAKRGLTQPQIAQLVGCSQACISDLVRGRVSEPRYSLGTKLLELSHRKPARRKPRAPELAGEAGHA